MRLRVRHGHVARKDVEQGRDVGRALDVRVTAKRQDPAAGPAHVPEQELDDRRGADVLDADGVLRPSDRVDERRRALPTRALAERFGHLEELLLRHAADPLHHLRRVAAEVLAQELEHAMWILHLGIHPRGIATLQLDPVRAVRLLTRDVGDLLALARGGLLLGAVVGPARDVVIAGLGVIPGEEPGQVLGVPKLRLDDHRPVGVGLDVLVEPLPVLDDVVDDAAEEGDVGSGSQGDVNVGDRARAGEARVGVDDLALRARRPQPPTGTRPDGTRPCWSP